MARVKDHRGTMMAAGIGLALAGRELIQRMREADLRGQVALVAGGSRGLGLLIGRELAREGCRLAICARDAAELERARAELAEAGAEVLAIPCDIRDQGQVAAMVALPTIAVYVVLQRHFIRGLTAGAVK